jgi:hypothetical protein
MKRFTVLAASLLVAGCAGSGGSWVTLLDGPSGMDNFTQVGAEPANWQIKDGTLFADRGGKTPSYMVSKESYGDFNLRVEFWASHDANSGVFTRCADPKSIGDTTCYEVNIFDQRPDPSFGTGGIVHVAKVPDSKPQAGGKWNVFEITMKGPHLVVVMNGEKTVDMYHSQLSYGPIALQWGRGVIKFRKVEIQEL